MAEFLSKIVQQDGTMVALVDGKSYTATRDMHKYNDIKKAFQLNDADVFVELVTDHPEFEDLVERVSLSSNGKFNLELKDENVYLNGDQLHNSITDAIKHLYLENFDYQPLVNFLGNVLDGTSRRVLEELYSFIEQTGLTITEDGCFLAYKTVKDNYLDKHSGKFDNSPGAVNEMPRIQVDDDCTAGCSTGFHVGALAYAGPGGWYNGSDDRVVICKVNPKDVISVPKDHECQKLRCCKYTVVADFQGELKKAVYSGEIDDDYSSDYDEEEDNFDSEKLDDAGDMLIGWTYEFDYVDKQGNTSHRYIIVNDKDIDHIHASLVEPEEHTGEHRQFLMDNMSNIYEYSV